MNALLDHGGRDRDRTCDFCRVRKRGPHMYLSRRCVAPQRRSSTPVADWGDTALGVASRGIVSGKPLATERRSP
jgi:hypothetical protein